MSPLSKAWKIFQTSDNTNSLNSSQAKVKSLRSQKSSATLNSTHSSLISKISTKIVSDSANEDSFTLPVGIEHEERGTVYQQRAFNCHIIDGGVYHNDQSEPGSLNQNPDLSKFSSSLKRPKKYVGYRILATQGMSQWTTIRRYSEFHQLHVNLRRLYPNILLPPFPPKKIFGNQFSPQFIQDRRDKLNQYLRELLDVSAIKSCPEFNKFMMDSKDSQTTHHPPPSLLVTKTSVLSPVSNGDGSIRFESHPNSENPSRAPSPTPSQSDVSPITPPNYAYKRANSINSDDLFERLTKKSYSDFKSFQMLASPRSQQFYSSSEQTSPQSSIGKSPVVFTFTSAQKKPKACLDDFMLLKVIGEGSYGKVMMARHKESGKVYAIKALSKKQIAAQPDIIARVMQERNVLKKALEHPFLVSLRYSFQTPSKLYFCLDYVNGGELYFHLKKERRFDEDRARFYAAELTTALGYLHAAGIVYRDMKPENCLLDHQGHIRLVDFGLAKEVERLNEGARTATFCGTPEYLAPEILMQQPYNKDVDWYGLGALVYEMVVGQPPFYSPDLSELYDRILHDRLRFPSFISPLSRSFILSLLQRDPERRLGGGPNGYFDVKDHPFFSSIDFSLLIQKKIPPPFVPKVNGLFDLEYFDPSFHTKPISSSIYTDTHMKAVDSTMEQRMQADIATLFKPSNALPHEYNQHTSSSQIPQFFSSTSRFSLHQNRHQQTAIDDVEWADEGSTNEPFDLAFEDQFEGFSYVGPPSHLDDQNPLLK